jgi:hypothetical protein
MPLYIPNQPEADLELFNLTAKVQIITDISQLEINKAEEKLSMPPMILYIDI